MIEELDEIDLKLKSCFSRGLRPIPNITVSEWANTYRFLSSTASAEPGRYNVGRTPYLREIMDHLGKTSDMQEIIFMKGAQIGATEASLTFVGYSIDMNPSIILLVMPTDEAIKKTSKTRIKPMIDATPVLRSKIGQAGGRDSDNTINTKSFEGGVLMMIGANSPVGLSSTPAAKILLDEVDRMPKSAGEEGSPVDLARARARTFSNRKIFLISTPTLEGDSVIEKEFKQGDCRYYHVECQFCNDLFVITWDCITWDNDDHETAKCACPHCGGLHEDRHKTKMMQEEGSGGRAKWIASKKSTSKRKISYHLSGLYSPAGFYSWSEAVHDYLKAKGNDNDMKVWTNTVLGETYKISGEAPEYEVLYSRREDYPIGSVPDEVAFLTMGVDIQKDRIEAEVVGWCKGKTTYSIEYVVLPGDTSKPEVWDLLREQVGRMYPCSDGRLMSIKLTCVDANYNTSYVYDFCNSMGHSVTVPVQGRDRQDVIVAPPKVVNVSRSGKKIGTSKLWGVGSSLVKAEIYGFLKLQASDDGNGGDAYPNGYCHFPQYGREYFQMLTAEEQRLTKNKKTGYSKWEWVKIRDRNEALDVRVYARAAAYIVGIDRFKDSSWEKIKEANKHADKPLETPKAPRPEKKKQNKGWFDRR